MLHYQSDWKWSLSKWSLYWMVLGLYIEWKTFKTINVNLWQSDKPVKKTWQIKFFGWFVKLPLICVGFSRFLKKVSCFIKFLRFYDAQNSSKQLLVISALNSLITASVAYQYPENNIKPLGFLMFSGGYR